MTTLPSVDHPTGRPNFYTLNMPGLTVWFSYRTPIAYREHAIGCTFVRVNDWAQTTGRHLNEIDGGSAASKRARVDGATFEHLLAEVCERMGAALALSAVQS